MSGISWPAPSMSSPPTPAGPQSTTPQVSIIWRCLNSQHSHERTPTHRQDLIHFFKKDSRLVWDGLDLIGERFPAFFRSLPSSKHEILAVDVQPIGPDPPLQPQKGGMLRVGRLLMVVVTGRVQYGVKPAASGFHHSFLLERDPSPPLGIINDNQAAELRAQGGNFFWVSAWTHRSHKVDLGGAPAPVSWHLVADPLGSPRLATSSFHRRCQPMMECLNWKPGGKLSFVTLLTRNPAICTFFVVRNIGWLASGAFAYFLSNCCSHNLCRFCFR